MELGWGVAGHCVLPIQSWPAPYIHGMPGYSAGVVGLAPGIWPQAQQYPAVVTAPPHPRRAATPPQVHHEDDTPEPPAKRQRVGGSYDWAPDFDTSLFELEKQDSRLRLVEPPLLTPAPTPSPEQQAPEDLSTAEETDPLAVPLSPASYSANSPACKAEEPVQPYLPKLEPISPPEPTDHRPESPEEVGETTATAPIVHYQVTALNPDGNTPNQGLQHVQPPPLQPMHAQEQPANPQVHLQTHHPHQEPLHQPLPPQQPLLQQQPQPIAESLHLEQLGTVTISSAYPLMQQEHTQPTDQHHGVQTEHHQGHPLAMVQHSRPHHAQLQHPSHYVNDTQHLQATQEQQVIPIAYVQVNHENAQNMQLNLSPQTFRPAYAGDGLPEPPRRRMVRAMASCKYTREKNAECYICNKKYESKYKLKLHMYSHTGERPFVCEVCGVGFTRGPNLNAHRRVHSGAKPYPCTRCGRGFRHPSDRIVHMVTEVCTRVSRHVQAIAGGWMCGACGEENFESEEQAERHARQHETGRAMACPVCLQNFKGCKAHRLVRHVRENHPEYIASLGL